MVTKTTVVCWIFGIIGIIGFISSMFSWAVFGGPQAIVSTMFVLGAMYFNIKYKQLAREKARQESLDRVKSMQESLDREKARREATLRAESVSNDKKTKETNLT